MGYVEHRLHRRLPPPRRFGRGGRVLVLIAVDRVVPGYFSEGMAAAKLDQRVFARLLHAHLPAVGLHLESLAPDDASPASSLAVAPHPLRQRPPRAPRCASGTASSPRAVAPALRRVHRPVRAQRRRRPRRGRHGRGDRTPPGPRRRPGGRSLRRHSRLASTRASRAPSRPKNSRGDGEGTRSTQTTERRGLPERVRATAPVTEWMSSSSTRVGLRDVVGPRALARGPRRRLLKRQREATRIGSSRTRRARWEWRGRRDSSRRERAPAKTRAATTDGGLVDGGGDSSHGRRGGASAIAAEGRRVDASAAASDETFVSGSGSPALAFGSPLASLGVASSSPDPESGPRAATSPASLDLLGVESLDRAGPAGLALPPADAERIAERLLDVDRRLRALPTRASAFARVARIAATRPLTATRTSRLDALLAEFARDETEFRLSATRVGAGK